MSSKIEEILAPQNATYDMTFSMNRPAGESYQLDFEEAQMEAMALGQYGINNKQVQMRLDW